jgi:hypothetical protein
VAWGIVAGRADDSALVEDRFDIGKIIGFVIVDYDRERLGCPSYTTNNNGAFSPFYSVASIKIIGS